MARALTGPIRGDVHSVPAVAHVAEPLGSVAAEIDEHGVAVVGLAPPESAVFIGSDHVDHRHGGLDAQSCRERRVGFRGVEMPVPPVVSDELRERSGLAQHRVDQPHAVVAVEFPEAEELRPKVPNAVELADGSRERAAVAAAWSDCSVS